MDLFVDLKAPAVGGSRWNTAERQGEEKSLCANDLHTLLDFCGSPQIDMVERVKGIEPSSSAWEAEVIDIIRHPLDGSAGQGRHETGRHSNGRAVVMQCGCQSMRLSERQSLHRLAYARLLVH